VFDTTETEYNTSGSFANKEGRSKSICILKAVGWQISNDMYQEYGVMNILAGKAAEDTQTPRRKQGPNVIVVVSIIILLIALSISGILLFLANKSHVAKHIASTATPTPTPTNIYMETPPPQAVFYDTFINNALGWGLSNNAGYIRTLADHKLTLTNTNPNTTLIESLPTNAIYDNFIVSVDLTIVKAGMNDSAGIYIRGDSNLDHDYRIEINGGTTFDIAKEYLDSQNNPHAAFLDGPRSSSALHPPGVQNTITVTMKGSQLMLYINNAEVSSITDSDYTTGQIALFAHTGMTSSGDTVSFSRVEVDHTPDQVPVG